MVDDYITVSIPKDIDKIIVELIDCGLGFKSKAEVIKEAVRTYYLRVKELHLAKS